MSKYAIEIIGLGKRYHRGSSGRIQNAGDVMRALRKPFAKRDEAERGYFWALKDVSFALEQGDILGIVGANGAGKSTLLKILSRIVAPTEGKIIMNGRVGALLEVGTGFHEELTGRENVYLNGAILGLKQREIARLFDEIVDFAGVEAFIDTPIKHYSSGMRLRLGFAVAAHLNPEILIVDEVLAVGDDDFRRKSMGKMQDVANDGRTVLFVSHSAITVRNLCTIAIHLESGQVTQIGSPDTILDYYKQRTNRSLIPYHHDLQHVERSSGLLPIMQFIRLLDSDNKPIEACQTGDAVTFEIGYDCGEKIYHSLLIGIKSPDGERLFSLSTLFSPQAPEIIRGKGILRCSLPQLLLRDGVYSVIVAIKDDIGTNRDMVDNAMAFRVVFNDYFKTGAIVQDSQGYVVQNAAWEDMTDG